ncbi:MULTISPECIES: hypothetical protein [Rhizobium]|uniref:hypothetical protein n=1 Tax=Rhizobium phaseoli TaxID=396 RepID=UPI001806AEC9|nr:hypothetical protein [Rhizobium phaseoli]
MQVSISNARRSKSDSCDAHEPPQNLVSLRDRRPLLLLQVGDGNEADDPADLPYGGGVYEEGGQSGNRHLDLFFQDAVTNAVAFASYDADLKQYIFTFVGQRSTR